MGLDYCCTGICAGPNGNPPREYMIAHPDISQDEYENDWDVLEAFDMTDAEIAADASVCKGLDKATCENTVNTAQGNGQTLCKYFDKANNAIALEAGSQCVAKSYQKCKRRRGITAVCGISGRPPAPAVTLKADEIMDDDVYDDDFGTMEVWDYMDDAEIEAYASLCKGLDKNTCENTINKGQQACKYFDRPNNAIALEAGSQCVAKAYQKCKRRRGITAICGITARPPASAVTLPLLEAFDISDAEIAADASLCKGLDKATCESTVNKGQQACKYFDRPNNAIALEAGSQCVAKAYQKCKRRRGITATCGIAGRGVPILLTDALVEYDDDFGMEVFDYMDDAEIAADASLCKGLDKTTCENTVNKGQNACKYFDRPNNAIALEAGSQCVAKAYQKCKRRRGITAICGITARPPTSATTLPLLEAFDMSDEEIAAHASLCKGLDKATCESTVNKGANACKYFDRPNNAIALEAGSQCVAKAYQKCKRRRGITATCGIAGRDITAEEEYYDNMSDEEIAADAAVCKGLDETTCKNTVNTAQGNGKETCHYFEKPNNSIALQAGSQCVAKAYQRCKRRRGLTATCGIAGRGVPALESILMVEPIDMNNEDIDYMRWSLIGLIGLIVFGGLYKMFKGQNGKKYAALLEDKDYGATQSV